jgi:predicted ABC-class ATPase
MFTQRSGTVNGCNAERPRTFEPGRSNALERIVENVRGTVTFTFQKRKNYCILKMKYSKYYQIIELNREISQHKILMSQYIPESTL